jgi:hypothetical protein
MEVNRKKGLALFLAGINKDRKGGPGSKVRVGVDVPQVKIARVPQAVSHLPDPPNGVSHAQTNGKNQEPATPHAMTNGLEP